jgi:hypothetical protein
LPALIFNDSQEVEMSWQDKDLTFLLLNFGENKTFLLFNVTKIVLRFVLKKGNFLGWGLARFPHSNPPIHSS